ncbi:MAG: exodeoxyribonuclease VII large subunit [Candidatus Andersenbacteria bacterium]|nr:exodeoxyribonuclease VII large subunit [Candidatus Andersenbacteria bacterium]
MLSQMEKVLTVTQFVRLIDEALSAYDGVAVEGEVAEFKIIHDKWVTFQLKDATSTIGCFMTLWQYKTPIEDGMLVRAEGRPRLRDKGFFSFVVEAVQPTGEGGLKRAFELLKAKLEAEGLFAAARKRHLPRFPQRIALITSRDAAAYSDFLKVLQARTGGLTISFIHSPVQGEDAPRQLMAALTCANTSLKDIEVIVMVRGGGSLEDLMAFNDEAVVRTVAGCRVPIIVGVGHERDITLAELAADVRASTPSNAAEILVRSRQELASEIAQLRQALRFRMQDALTQHRAVVRRIVDLLRGHVRTVGAHLQQLTRVLASLSPQRVLQRGYSITRRENGRVVMTASQVVPGERLVTQLKAGRVVSSVIKLNAS